MSAGERRKDIEAAIADLRPLAGADVEFVIRGIERLLDLRQSAIEVRPPLPSEGAAQLRALATALRATKEAASNLNKLAFEQLNAAKVQRGLKWYSPAGSIWSFLRRNELSDFIDSGYPSLIEAAEDAAKRLDQMKAGGRPEGRNQYLSALAAVLAAYYELLTGRFAPKSKSENRFSRFVGTIFAAGGIRDSVQDRHYAAVGADLHRRSKGAKPTEISWFMRLE
jgi:hypothetical protein